MEPTTGANWESDSVDTDPMDTLSANTKKLYQEVLEMNFRFETDTAGEKAAKTKGGQITS